MLGHWRPLFLGFARGGKMVATTGGVVLALAPLVALVGAGLWIAVFLVTRYASVASILAALSLPSWALLFDASWPVIVFCRRRGGRDRRPPPREHAPSADGTENRFELAAAPARPRALRLGPSQSLSSVWRAGGSPLSSSARSSPAVPEALGQDVVVVDRLEVDLPREEEVAVGELRRTRRALLAP